VANRSYHIGAILGSIFEHLIFLSLSLLISFSHSFMLDVVRAVRLRTVEMDLEAHPSSCSSSLSSTSPSVTPADLAASSQRGLAVALSLGELPSETYKAFYEAGASRYLLRIESSNPILYHKLHPPSHSFEARQRCLDELRRIGFQVGTGVMVGVPYQDVQDMAGDLLFFKVITLFII
jgi:hypothetical protein